MAARRSRRALSVLLLLLESCGGGRNPVAPTPPATPTVVSVGIAGDASNLTVGSSVQLQALATLSDGSTQNVTSQATWESSNVSVATVTASGILTAVGSGSAEIRASYQQRTGTREINVVPGAGLRCGFERWSVKTLSDPEASRVDLSQVTFTTVRALNEFASHCNGGPDRRTYPEEFRVFEVVGRITYVKLEDDRDYHVAVADPQDPSFTVITEVADPQCTGPLQSPHLSALVQGRNDFAALLRGGSPGTLVGRTVRLRGVGFYDFNHGQVGRARNCIELHPVISIAPTTASTTNE